MHHCIPVNIIIFTNHSTFLFLFLLLPYFGIAAALYIYMNIGLNPGPRARTVKPGPRHLRTRPDPGQNRLGPHKGIPSGEARQCIPAGTEILITHLKWAGWIN